MCNCEDRPCCGHPAEELADARYAAEREYERGWIAPEDEWQWEEEEEEDCDFCERCGGSYDDPESDEACCCGGDDYGREDSALESSIFGDC